MKGLVLGLLLVSYSAFAGNHVEYCGVNHFEGYGENIAGKVCVQAYQDKEGTLFKKVLVTFGDKETRFYKIEDTRYGETKEHIKLRVYNQFADKPDQFEITVTIKKKKMTSVYGHVDRGMPFEAHLTLSKKQPQQMPKGAVAGTVEAAWIGEVGPYIGDYCVMVIEGYDGRRYGLVSDEGPEGPVCDDATAYEGLLGFAVLAHSSDMRKLTDLDLLAELVEYHGRDVYFVHYDSNVESIE